jgi:hypothetical protein
VPCMKPAIARCRQDLATAGRETPFACAPAPDRAAIDTFCEQTSAMLDTLPAPAVGRHFSSFCRAMHTAADAAGDLGAFVTAARRTYETPAGSDYLEIAVTRQARTASFGRFVADMAIRAEDVARAYNEVLGEYRTLHAVRSAAQPFPDLDTSGEAVELPFWSLAGGVRRPLRAVRGARTVQLLAGEDALCELPDDPAQAAAVACSAAAAIAPRAVALTLFERMFVADLFIHGLGGARYDAVTDELARRLYGVEPPPFVTASMTLYLPLGLRIVTDADLAAARRMVTDAEHNPDRLLGQAQLDDEADRARAVALVQRKTRLVERIAEPGADRKTLGLEIKTVNAELVDLLKPVVAGLHAEVARLEEERSASDVLTDRTYPLCFWDPMEVRDKVR